MLGWLPRLGGSRFCRPHPLGMNSRLPRGFSTIGSRTQGKVEIILSPGPWDSWGTPSVWWMFSFPPWGHSAVGSRSQSKIGSIWTYSPWAIWGTPSSWWFSATNRGGCLRACCTNIILDDIASLLVSRMLHSAIGSRLIPSSLVRAILWLVLLWSRIADPAFRVHHWTIVRTATLALAGLLDEIISAKGNRLWILESPVRRPVWGFWLPFPFSFATFVSMALSFLLPERLADGVPPWALLVLAFLWFTSGPFGDDSFIDFPHPEQAVVLDLLKGFFEIHATMHRLMHLSPCIALCHEQCLFRGGRPAAPQLRSIEPIIERVKVFLRQVELRKLREGSQTHQQGVPENQVQSLQLTPCGWCCPFFLLFFLLPAVHCDLLTGLDGSLPFFRKGTDDVLGVNETNLTFAAKLVLATQESITPLVPVLWFWDVPFGWKFLLKLGTFAQDFGQGKWPRRSWSRSGHHRWVCLDHLFRGPHDLE